MIFYTFLTPRPNTLKIIMFKFQTKYIEIIIHLESKINIEIEIIFGFRIKVIIEIGIEFTHNNVILLNIYIN